MDGDRLILGVYEIEVRVIEDAQASWRDRPAAAAKPDPFGNPFGDDPFAPDGSRTPGMPSGSALEGYSPALPAEFDPLLPDEEAAFRDEHRRP